MTVLVRDAREGELDAIASLLACAFEEHRLRNGGSTELAYAEAFDRYFEEVVNVRARRDETQLFVAVENGRILGTGALYAPGRGDAYARAVHCKPWPDEWAGLRLVGVDPAHRNRGIGRMLIEARVRRARELGAKAAALHTSRERAAARHLIERMGWTRAPEYDHAPVPDVCAEAYVLALA